MGDGQRRGREAASGNARLALEARKRMETTSSHFEFAFMTFGATTQRQVFTTAKSYDQERN